MARRSKLKRQRLFWFRRMETLSKPGTEVGYSQNSGPLLVIKCIMALNLFQGTTNGTLILGTTQVSSYLDLPSLLLLPPRLVVSSDNLEEAFATFPDGSQAIPPLGNIHVSIKKRIILIVTTVLPISSIPLLLVS